MHGASDDYMIIVPMIIIIIGKFVLVLKHHTKKTNGGEELQLHSFITYASASKAGSQSASLKVQRQIME